MCVFIVSKRRLSWILGQVVSLWAGVLCNHTHKHSEDSHQECRVGRRGGPCPLTSTHTHAFFFHCLLHPAPCQALIPQRLEKRGLQVVPLSFYRLGNWDPQFTAPSHTAGVVFLYRGFFFTHPPIPADSSVPQICSQPRNQLLYQNQPIITTVQFFIVSIPGMTWHRDPPYLWPSALLFHTCKVQPFTAKLLESFSQRTLSLRMSSTLCF